MVSNGTDLEDQSTTTEIAVKQNVQHYPVGYGSTISNTAQQGLAFMSNR